MKLVDSYILVLSLLLVSFIPFELPAQDVSISSYEKRWAIFHPIAAIRVKHIAKHCKKMYEAGTSDSRLDAYVNGGKLDAYRHAFYMATFSQKLSVRKIKKLGLAHEKGNYKQFKKSQSENGEVPDSLSSEMDLQNNDLGIRLGQANKRLTYEELSDLILTEIEMGKAFIMKRSTIGMYLRCDEQPLILNDYKGVWSVPKCMTESNYTYP